MKTQTPCSSCWVSDNHHLLGFLQVGIADQRGDKPAGFCVSTELCQPWRRNHTHTYTKLDLHGTCLSCISYRDTLGWSVRIANWVWKCGLITPHWSIHIYTYPFPYPSSSVPSNSPKTHPCLLASCFSSFLWSWRQFLMQRFLRKWTSHGPWDAHTFPVTVAGEGFFWGSRATGSWERCLASPRHVSNWENSRHIFPIHLMYTIDRSTDICIDIRVMRTELLCRNVTWIVWNHQFT